MSEWIDIAKAPDFVRMYAEQHSPRLGELVKILVRDMDGSIWVVGYSNPGAVPLRAFKVPEYPK